jgi:hypothetical protein
MVITLATISEFHFCDLKVTPHLQGHLYHIYCNDPDAELIKTLVIYRSNNRYHACVSNVLNWFGLATQYKLHNTLIYFRMARMPIVDDLMYAVCVFV